MPKSPDRSRSPKCSNVTSSRSTGLLVAVVSLAASALLGVSNSALAQAPAQPQKSAAQQAPAKETAKKSSKAATAEKSEGGASGQSIVALVNDEPITGYEVQQRQRLMGLSANIQEQVQANFKKMIQNPATTERLKAILGEIIQANKGKSKEQILAIFEERKKAYAMSLQKQAVENARASVLPGLRKNALEELIEERLKLQEAKRLNVLATDEDADRMIKVIAERNKMTDQQFAQHLGGMGVDVSAMRARFKVSLSWQDVIRRRFGHQISITQRDVDRFVSSASGGEDQVELQIQKITLAIIGGIDQKKMAERLKDAEDLRRKFTGCPNLANLAKSVPNTKLEILGPTKPTSIAEPTRTLLLNAKDEEMVPPSVGQKGIELWAVCSRKVVKADEQKRTAAQEELKQKEFELLAKRHLKDLRQDAHIELR